MLLAVIANSTPSGIGAPSVNVTWSNNVNGAITSSGDPWNASAPLTGGATSGIVVSDLSAGYGSLDILVHGEINETNFSGWWTGATVDAEWFDEVTINLTLGGSALVHASYRVVGTTTFSGSSESNLGMNWSTQVIVPGTIDNHSGGIGQFASPAGGPLDGTPDIYALPVFGITSGTPFSIYAKAGATGGASLAANGQGMADADFSLEWFGFTVTDGLGAPVSYTTTSQSGTDWSQPVPEPSAVGLLCLGGLAFAGRRAGTRRQGA